MSILDRKSKLSAPPPPYGTSTLVITPTVPPDGVISAPEKMSSIDLTGTLALACPALNSIASSWRLSIPLALRLTVSRPIRQRTFSGIPLTAASCANKGAQLRMDKTKILDRDMLASSSGFKPSTPSASLSLVILFREPNESHFLIPSARFEHVCRLFRRNQSGFHQA